jgi:hypothetical protein
MMLKLFNVAFKCRNDFVFPFEQPFFYGEILNFSFFGFNFIFKLLNLFVLLLGNSVDHIILMFLKNRLDLGEVSLDNVSHSAEALKQGRNFSLQSFTEDSCDLRFHRPYCTLDFFLVSRVLSHQSALELHDCLHDELELINFGFFFIGNDVIVFENLGNNFMKLHEGVGKGSFNLRELQYFKIL